MKDSAFTSNASTPIDSGQKLKRDNYASDEVLVRFVKDASFEAINAIQDKLHLQIIRTLSVNDGYLMRITDKTAVEEMIRLLKAYKEVLYAEPNYLYRKNTHNEEK